MPQQTGTTEISTKPRLGWSGFEELGPEQQQQYLSSMICWFELSSNFSLAQPTVRLQYVSVQLMIDSGGLSTNQFRGNCNTDYYFYDHKKTYRTRACFGSAARGRIAGGQHSLAAPHSAVSLGSLAGASFCHRWPTTRPTQPTNTWRTYTDLRGEKHRRFHSQVEKVHSPKLLRKECLSEVVRIGSIIIFHLSKLWKVRSSYCVM